MSDVNYSNSKDSNMLINVEDVKRKIETEKLGDFSGKSEKEVEQCYENLTKALNELIKNPCGKTSKAVRRIIC